MGWLADRWARKHVMLLIYVIVAAAIPLLLLADSWTMLHVFALLFGIGLGGDYMIIPLMAADLFGVQRLGRVMGFVLTADGLAEALSPMFVAGLRDRMGTLSPGLPAADGAGRDRRRRGVAAAARRTRRRRRRSRVQRRGAAAREVRPPQSTLTFSRRADLVERYGRRTSPDRRDFTDRQCRAGLAAPASTQAAAAGAARLAPVRSAAARLHRHRRTRASADRCVPGDAGDSRSCRCATPTRGAPSAAKARAGGKAPSWPTTAPCSTTATSTPCSSSRPITGTRRMALAALDAGKDVYLEKPMTYAADEGTAIIAAVDRTQRDAAGRQPGRQRRASDHGARDRRERPPRPDHAGARRLQPQHRGRRLAVSRFRPTPVDAPVDWAAVPRRRHRSARSASSASSAGAATGTTRAVWPPTCSCTWSTSIHYVLDVQMPSQVVAAGATHRWKDTHEVPDTIDAILTYPAGLHGHARVHAEQHRRRTKACTSWARRARCTCSTTSCASAPSLAGENNRWVVRSWPEALERAYYADPKVQASESPFLRGNQARPAGERWTSAARSDDVAHVRSFVDAVRSRTSARRGRPLRPPCGRVRPHDQQSIREGRVVRWDATTKTWIR